MGTIRDLNDLTALAATDYLMVADTSDLVDKDKKMLVSKLAIKNGTPVTDNLTSWNDANSIEDAGFSKSAVARKSGVPVAGHAVVWLDANTLQDGGVVGKDRYLESAVLLVDAAFTNNAAARRFSTIVAAVTACTGGETILAAPGTFNGNVIIAANNITLIGCGAPSYDSVSGRLVGGTIIRGKIDRGSFIGLTIKDLGVDQVGVNSQDCIAGPTIGTPTYPRFENLTLLGNGDAARAHGIYGGGSYNFFSNIRIRSCYHGIAIHGSFSNINNVALYSCSGTAVIIKAKSAIDCWHNNVSNVTMDGDPATPQTRSGPCVVQAEDGVSVRRCNFVNVTARYCAIGVINCTRNDALAGSLISECSFTNIASDGNLDNGNFGDYWIRTGNNIILDNCRSTNRVSGFAFRVDPADNVGDVYLYASYADATGGGPVSGIFRVSQYNASLVQALITAQMGVRGTVASVAADTVLDITPLLTQGMIMISPVSGVNQNTRYFFGAFRAATTPIMQAAAAGTDVLTSTAILTGTTGTAGKLTVSAASNGHIYVENRLAATVILQVIMFG